MTRFRLTSLVALRITTLSEVVISLMCGSYNFFWYVVLGSYFFPHLLYTCQTGWQLLLPSYFLVDL